MDESLIRESVRCILQEFLRTSDLIDMVMRLRVTTKDEDDPMVSDIITNIRVLPGVSVARQVAPVRHISGGKDVLQIQIKYATKERDTDKILDEIGHAIRAIKGVSIAMFLTVGGRPVRKADGSPYIY